MAWDNNPPGLFLRSKINAFKFSFFYITNLFS